MADADNIGRINVWRSAAVAADAATEASEIEAFGRMTIHPTAHDAKRRKHHEMPSGGGGGGYTASAVHFDGTASFSIGTAESGGLSVTDTGFTLRRVWFKRGTGDFQIIDVSDPNGTYINYWQVEKADLEFHLFQSVATTGSDKLYSYEMPALDTNWHMGLVATDLTAQKMIMYDGLTKVGDFHIDGTPTVATLNGFQFMVGDDGFGDPFIGDLCDYDIWVLGSSPLNGGGTDLATGVLDLFITAGGKPVDPTTAIAELGNSVVGLRGDATAWTAGNQGTGGAGSWTGSLTNATTSPSD